MQQIKNRVLPDELHLLTAAALEGSPRFNLDPVLARAASAVLLGAANILRSETSPCDESISKVMSLIADALHLISGEEPLERWGE
jgi:hypothetical protein